MYKAVSKKSILFVAILIVVAQLFISLAQDAGFSLAQTSACSLTASVSSNTPPAQSVSAGQTGISLVKFDLFSNCDVVLNSFAVSLLPMPNGYLNISSLSLYKDGAQQGSTLYAPAAGANFPGLNIAILSNQTISLEARGDISTSAISGSTVYGVFGGSSATSSAGPVGNNASGNIFAGNVMTISSSGGGGGGSSVPAAPTGLILNGTPTSTSIPLRWTDNSSNEDKFNINRKLTTSGSYIFLIQLTGSNITSYIDSTVAAGVSYDYSVQACHSGYGCSDYAYLIGVSSASSESLPYPPSSVSASSSAGKIVVNWTSSAAKYSIYRSVNGGTYQALYTNITNSYYDDLSVTMGSSYQYKVKGCTSDGVTCSTTETVSNSATYSGGTASCTGLNLTLNDGKTTYIIGESVNYTWTCSLGGSATSVYMWLYKPNGTSVNYNYGSGSTQSMGFSTSNLLAGTHTLKACFDSTCSTVNASQTFMVSTGGGGSDTASPSIPANLVATKDDYNQVDLSWAASIDNVGVSGYEVWRSTAGIWSKIGQVPIPPYIDTTVTASTPYYYKVIAYDAAGNKSSPSTHLFLNTPAASETGYSSSSSPTPAPSPAVPYLNAWINTVPYSSTYTSPALISGTTNAGATSNSSFPNLTFYLMREGSSTNYFAAAMSNLDLPEASSGGKNWSGLLNTSVLPDGTYKFYAKGFVNGATTGTEYSSNSVYFAVNNSTAPAPTLAPTVPIITVGIDSSASGVTVGGMRTVWANSNAPLTSLVFKFYNTATNVLSSYTVNGYPSTTTAPDTFGNYNYWLGNLDAVKLGNGKYKLIAKGTYNGSPHENTANFYFNVNNSGPSAMPAPMLSPLPPYPYPTPVGYNGNYSNTPSFGESAPMVNPPGVPPPPLPPSSFPPDAAMQFPLECRVKNVLNEDQCRQLMFQLGMPEVCLAGGAKTQEDCMKIIFLNSLPQECRDAKATSESDCNKVMFVKYGPKECSDARIFDKNECERFIFKKNAPPECISQGISTPEDCEKYMIGKYGNLDNIKAGNLPLDCQKAGARTVAECDRVMKDKYMPQDCKDQGINDAKQCDFYLSVKNMPPECKAAGAKSKDDCDKVMFKKFSPNACKQAGIENEKECKDFMFNLYAPRVTCDKLNEWDCKQEIKENHLGNIVAKQTDYKKIKEEISSLSGTSASIEKIKEKIGQGNKMIPLVEVKTVLKIVNADEKMVLSEKEDLVQSAPIVVAIDSDGDGLPDDTEKRIGTDPNNRDTDNDGVSDGEEIKNGYDPLGVGAMAEEAKDGISPIDWALIQDKTLGHPTVDGSESKDLVVNKVANLGQGGAAKGYELTGKGEKNSVMTIYIYSDMPVVATVKTDEFGNWKYEMNKSLVDGEHEVYVAVNDNTGKVVNKSQPLSFFVNEAKAVSVSDFITSQNIVAPKASEKAMSSYTIVAILAIIIGIIIFVFTIIKRKKQVVA